MDELELLKQDHQKVKQLFEQCQTAKDKKQQKQIFKEIKTELETHTRLEETIFYPAIEEYEELKDMVLESLEEHKQVKNGAPRCLGSYPAVNVLSRNSKS